MCSIFGHFRSRQSPAISIIVAAYDMAREIPRTLQSLTSDYQRDGHNINYEVIVVDNGSPEPLSEDTITAFGPQFKLLRINQASPSPVRAINQAAQIAKGQYLGIIIDGARMLSPGVLYWARQAFSLNERAVASVLGFHLGPDHQRLSSEQGYNQTVEDKLLDAIAWPQQGYRLFDIASLAGSSKFGWLAPLAESNCLLLSKKLYEEVGGFDEHFASPGGGLANLDFYKRCLSAPDITLYHLLGEGCFHQIHGGVTTGGSTETARYEQLTAEYERIRGEPHRVPHNTPVLLGESQPHSLWLMASACAAHAENNHAQDARLHLFAHAGIAPPKQ